MNYEEKKRKSNKRRGTRSVLEKQPSQSQSSNSATAQHTQPAGTERNHKVHRTCTLQHCTSLRKNEKRSKQAKRNCFETPYIIVLHTLFARSSKDNLLCRSRQGHIGHPTELGMSKSAPSKVQGPQLALVVCGSVDKTAMTKLNLNCPLGIFLSYSLQTLRVELDKKIKEVNEQSDLVVFEIPPNTPDDRIEAETTAAKETALAEKERLNGLAVKLNEIAAKMTAASVHRIELLDESNGLVQCQDVSVWWAAKVFSF